MVKIVSVKFKNGGKTYYFAPNDGETYEKGMGVIVETAKGLEYATVVQPAEEVEDDKIVSPLKPVVRIATPRDEETVRRNREKRGEAMKTAQEKIAERGLEMKLVDCEFPFDGNKVVFYFTSETRVDFRELIKDLSSAFHSRIELRQISIRDEIKLTGGLAPCGRECCCINCMAEPLKVSVKMAKNQGLSLNPGKISGLCGRLMCCLAYENDYYSEVCKQVPKLGSEAETPDGKGTVVNVNMLKMQVKVKIEQNDSVTYHDYDVNDIRFMRGNVMMGRESFDNPEESAAEPAQDGEQVSSEVKADAGHERGKRRPDRAKGENGRPEREKGNGDRGEKRNDRPNRNNRRPNRGGNEPKQSNEARQNNENKQNSENRQSAENRENRGVKEGANFKNSRRRRHGNNQGGNGKGGANNGNGGGGNNP